MKQKAESLGGIVRDKVSRIWESGIRMAGICMCAVLCIAAGALLVGCSASGEKTYTREELQNLARIEVYEAESDTLLRTIEDGETLYRYLQAFEAEPEEGLGEEAAEGAEESYYFEFYMYPVAKFGDKEPKKAYTIVLYQDTDIARIVGDAESLHMAFLSEDLLTFYYRTSEEEQAFYNSLLIDG